jgi:F0F1-type ATP synthase membrane subunit b/b'
MSDLSALLDREASAEIETLLSEARQRASEIVAEATAEAEQLLV